MSTPCIHSFNKDVLSTVICHIKYWGLFGEDVDFMKIRFQLEKQKY